MKKLLSFCLSLVLVVLLVLPVSALAAHAQPQANVSAASDTAGDAGDVGDADLEGADDADAGYEGCPVELVCPCGPTCSSGDNCKCTKYDPNDYYSDYRPYSTRNLWEQWGFDNPEEFMEFYADMVLEYEYEYIDIEQPFWMVYASYHGSLEAFLIMYNLDMEEYLLLEAAWEKYRGEFARRLVETLVEMGGTVGIVNVMLNGEFLKFDGVVPELDDGVTYVPARAFFEALGGTVNFKTQDGTISAKYSGVEVLLTVGEDMMLLVEEDGVEDDLHIDHAPYIKGGVSYIPIRTVAHVLGFDVYWDSRYKTVVIIDTQAIVDEINKDFTVINRTYQMQGSDNAAGDSGMTKTDITVKAAMTQFNSLDGDTVAEFGGVISYTTDGRNVNLTATADLSALFDMMLAESMAEAEYYYYMYGDLYDELYDDGYFAPGDDYLNLIDSLRSIEVELILSYNEDKLYLKSPALMAALSEALSGELGEELSEELGIELPEFPADAWLSMSGINAILNIISIGDILDSVLYDFGFSGGFDGLSMGDSIVSMHTYSLYPYYYSSYWYRNQINLYNEIMETAAFYTALYGDEKFVKTGNEYTLSLTLDDMRDASRESGMNIRYSAFSYELVIEVDGDETVGVSGKTVYRDGYYRSYYETQYTNKFEITPAGSHYMYETHEKNEGITRIDLDIVTEPSTTPILTSPPQGAVIIDIEDLIPEDYYDEYIYNPIVPLSVWTHS